MSPKKRLKLGVLWVARACGLFALARLVTGSTVRILGFHYVSMHDEETRFKELFLTPDELRVRLAHLQRHYQIVSLDEAVEALRSGQTGRGKVALTFDDGLYNFAAAAAPVLEEYGATATVYVVTAHVVNGIPVCPLLLRDIFAQSNVEELRTSIPELGPDSNFGTERERKKLAARATEHLMTLPHGSQERLDFVRRVGRALGVDPDPLLARRTWDVLNADDMRALHEQGFDIQVHGHHHVNVVEEQGEIFDEVDASRRVISDITGADANDYCYPFGLWTRQAWPSLERAGIRSATTTLYGLNSPKTPLLSLRRFMDGGNTSHLEFEFELSGLRWLLWSLSHRGERWQPAEKLELYTSSGQLY